MTATRTRTRKPTVTYFDALGMTADGGEVTAKTVQAAYRKIAKTEHPDAGGNAEKFALITAAYNALSTDEAILMYAFNVSSNHFTNAEKSWARAWNALTTATPKAEAPSSGDSAERYVFVPREGESKDDKRKRYARESQQFRYARDPEYAQKRREASVKSHTAKRARDKAAKSQAAAA